MKISTGVAVLLLFTAPAFSESASESQEKANPSWKGTLRTSFLKNFDRMLAAIFDEKARTYAVEQKNPQRFQNNHLLLEEFNQKYAYFSEESPIVGRVTNDLEDLHATQEVLKAIHQNVTDPMQREITTAEVLTKLLAYRDLKEGEVVAFSTQDAYGRVELGTYVVDRVLDLWRGMPAYGLVPQAGTNGAPILLFRGTDFSLVTVRGWASVISDLEINDPGLSAFEHGQPEIHAWLEKVARSHVKARVMGFSLGGILAAYTLLYERPLINAQLFSYSFNAPGVSREILQEWTQERTAPFRIFVTEGDLIPKYGRLLDNTQLFSQEEFLTPLAAHVDLITFSSVFHLQSIDSTKENANRK